MTTAFDTLKLATKLESAGFTAQQARGAVKALSESLTVDLATKSDIAELRADFKADIAVMKWMIGFVLALVVAIFVKAYLK